LFGLDRQVYYRRIRRKAKHLVLAEQAIALVQSIRLKMPRLGTRKLYYLLQAQLDVLGIGRDKLFSILRANHLMIHPKKSYRVTTNTYHRFYKHTDVVSSLQINRPEQVWVADITYVGNRAANSYLALITDAYSKKIVGYDLSDSLSVQGSLRALKMALSNRRYSKEALIHHSDKGIQYCCDQYQELLMKGNLKCSMTQGYDPYSNAVAERVNGIIKGEFGLEEYNVTMGIMKKIVAESVEIYNQDRPHLSCSLLTPNQMHKQQLIKIKTYKSKTGSRFEPASR
jgi:putative transposase